MAHTDRERTNFARRTLLKGAAALPLAAAAPAVALASPLAADPVFAALEAHRTALAAWLLSVDEESHFDEALLARCGCLVPSIVIPGLPKEVAEVHSQRQINAVVEHLCEDAEQRETIRGALYRELDEKLAHVRQARAELDEEGKEARYVARLKVERAALATLIATVPTTLPGLLALLDHLARREVFGDGVAEADELEAAMATIRESVRAIAGGAHA